MQGPGGQGWLLERLGNDFTLLVHGEVAPETRRALDKALATLEREDTPMRVLWVLAPGARAAGEDQLIDSAGVLAERYDLRRQAVYLIRPDQHVSARWRHLDPDAVVRAVHRSLGQELAEEQAA